MPGIFLIGRSSEIWKARPGLVWVGIGDQRKERNQEVDNLILLWSRTCPKAFTYLYFCLFFSWEAGARIASNLEAPQGRSGTTVGPRWQERWRWRKQLIIQTCAKGKRESEAHAWPGPIHHRWEEARSGGQPLHTFSWSVFLLVSSGKYGSELGMVLEEVAAVGYHDR